MPADVVHELLAELCAAHYTPDAGLEGWRIESDGSGWFRESDGISLSVGEAFQGQRRVWAWQVCAHDAAADDYTAVASGTNRFPREAMRAAEAALVRGAA